MSALVFVLGYMTEVIVAGWWVWLLYLVHRVMNSRRRLKPPNFKKYLIIAASWGIFMATFKILVKYSQ